jgi:class 3 adenylate cyclase
MGEIMDFRSNGRGGVPRQPESRQLAAIVAGDISRYSRLIEADEQGTHDRLRRIERELLQPSISAHQGELVKAKAGGFIAIFDSPVQAAQCGISIRQSMAERNTALPKHHRIEYRIGVNLGDVVTETNDLYGHGLEIASGLEAIAAPGQIYISGSIYEQIKHKLACAYECLGDRKLNCATDPVRVYQVLPDPDAIRSLGRRREKILISLLSLSLLIIATGAIWYFFGESHRQFAEKAVVSRFEERNGITSSDSAVVKEAAPSPQLRPAEELLKTATGVESSTSAQLSTSNSRQPPFSSIENFRTDVRIER